MRLFFSFFVFHPFASRLHARSERAFVMSRIRRFVTWIFSRDPNPRDPQSGKLVVEGHLKLTRCRESNAIALGVSWVSGCFCIGMTISCPHAAATCFLESMIKRPDSSVHHRSDSVAFGSLQARIAFNESFFRIIYPRIFSNLVLGDR